MRMYVCRCCGHAPLLRSRCWWCPRPSRSSSSRHAQSILVGHGEKRTGCSVVYSPLASLKMRRRALLKGEKAQKKPPTHSHKNYRHRGCRVIATLKLAPVFTMGHLRLMRLICFQWLRRRCARSASASDGPFGGKGCDVGALRNEINADDDLD